MKAAEPFTIPVRVVSEANRRGHWRTRHKRQVEQREITLGVLSQFGLSPDGRKRWFGGGQWVITLTKVGGGKLDSDNLAGSMKCVRDTIARWMTIDDGDDRLTWVYGQRPGGEHSVEMEISAKGTVTP